MTQTVHTQAFVLKAVPYGDRDIIVTMLGRDTGRFSAIARSARASRKRFAGGLQPLRHFEATFTRKPQRDLVTLSDVHIVQDFPGIEASFEKITIASYITELIRELSQEGEDSCALFDLLIDFYAHLNALEPTFFGFETALRHVELRILEIYGALPSLHACARCGQCTSMMPKFLCSRHGEGLICPQCRHQTEALGRLEPHTLHLLHYFLEPGPDYPAAIHEVSYIEQARRVIQSSFHGIMIRDLKSKPMLQSLNFA